MDIASIQKRISSIEELKNEQRVASEAISNALANDSSYQQVVKESKEVNAKKKRLRDSVLETSENKEVVAKLRDIKEEISTLEDLLAYELMEYSQKNNTDIIEGADGLVRKFKILVKLMPGRGFEGELGDN